MKVINSVIALVAILVMTTMSKQANFRFRRAARLPMQWSLSGNVNWAAGSSIGLSFTPIAATCVLVVAVLSTIMLEPRPGQQPLNGKGR